MLISGNVAHRPITVHDQGHVGYANKVRARIILQLGLMYLYSCILGDNNMQMIMNILLGTHMSK